MLNLYLTPRGLKGLVPTEEAIEQVLDFLKRVDIIGDHHDGAYTPGAQTAQLFHHDAYDDLLPAELTFDALRVETVSRARLLPRNHGEGFPHTLCGVCGDEIGDDVLQPALGRLNYFPIDRFELRCPSCGSDLKLKEVDFGQPTAMARFWIFIEGAGTSRLDTALLDKLGRILGLNLTVIPEVPEDLAEDWVPARRAGRR
ncbi:MAG: hypothetical protein ACE366_28035 [Bradymonadia bacterium]